MTTTKSPRPQRLDSKGHSLMRLFMRRPDVIDARRFEGTTDVYKAFCKALETAELVNEGIDGHLSTWRVFEDVLISVDRNGIVKTVHRMKWEPGS